MSRYGKHQIFGLLTAVVLGVTVLSLALQRQFGMSPLFTLLAPMLAAVLAWRLALRATK